MTLGRDWDSQDISGWFLSEKFDGCRAYWDGAQFWTRGGNIIKSPEWFTQGLPSSAHLDCEIWAGYGQFTASRLAVQLGRFTAACRLIVHDCPTASGNWVERMAVASHLIARTQAQVATTIVCRNEDHALDFLQQVIQRGGEGLVARNPEVAVYETGRTSSLLKIKDATRLYERMSWEIA